MALPKQNRENFKPQINEGFSDMRKGAENLGTQALRPDFLTSANSYSPKCPFGVTLGLRPAESLPGEGPTADLNIVMDSLTAELIVKLLIEQGALDKDK